MGWPFLDMMKERKKNHFSTDQEKRKILTPGLNSYRANMVGNRLVKDDFEITFTEEQCPLCGSH